MFCKENYVIMQDLDRLHPDCTTKSPRLSHIDLTSSQADYAKHKHNVLHAKMWSSTFSLQVSLRYLREYK